MSRSRLRLNLAETHSFHLRCAYPLGLFPRAVDGPALVEMCLAHSHVIPAEDYSALTAEADRARAIAILQQKAQALQAEIEERKKVQQALRDSNKDLHEAVESRDVFLSVAAHELRTPITTLRGFAQLLQRDIERNREISPQRLDAALEAIEGQTRKLTQLVGRLLDSAQIEAGKLRIEPVKSDLVALVRSVLEQQRSSANHQFIFDAPDHLEAVVDPLRFEQVITNLLDNAVKFSPQGGKVTVGLAVEGGDILLSVTDEGVGIPADERDHLFDRFHQTHAARHLSGLGLGLYITREIVELHGGRVRIEQPAHPGTRFVVELPSKGQRSGIRG
jgi:signal transduction histidine kinase